MGKLEQTFAWSESRVRTLRECRRKYHLYYNVSWEGWLGHAPQEKRRAYTLKNMTNLPMFAGSIVHNIIERIIRDARETGKWMPLQEAQKIGVQALRRGWIDSTQKRWEASPKNYVNLEEHFYGMEIDKGRTDTYKQKVLTCLKTFYDCPLFQIIKSLKQEDWLSLEEFQRFKMKTGEEVTVKIDCGFRHNGKIYLLDWKTGKVSGSAIDQLVTYAMYAIKMGWAKKPQDIVIVPVYLAMFSEIGEDAMPELNVTMDMMKRQAKIISDEYPMLVEAFDKRSDTIFFKRTDDEHKCRRCQFRDMCEGAKTEIEDGDTPF